MSIPQKQVRDEKEPQSRYIIFLNVIICVVVVLVTVVYLLYPVLQEPDFLIWLNSSNLFTFVFYILFLLIMLVIPKGEVIKKSESEKIPGERIKVKQKCYCCDKDYPLNEMKVLLVCKKCQKDQHVE